MSGRTVFSEKILKQHLASHPWREQTVVLDSVDSTNTYCKTLAATAPHGTVVLANYQTGGRGRLGRSFSSPKGLGLYCSVILRYRASPQTLLHLTPMAAVAAVRAVAGVTGLQPQIKWINDLVADGKKLCGILTELVLLPEETVCIVGIGINCGQRPEDFPEEIRHMATSLLQLGAAVERERLAAALIENLWFMAEQCLSEPESWMAEYRRRCLTIGREVRLIGGNGVRQAFAEDVDAQGALLVRLPDGSKEKVFSGEVSVRGMYGYV